MKLLFLRRKGLGLDTVRGMSGHICGHTHKQPEMTVDAYVGDKAGYVLSTKQYLVNHVDLSNTVLVRWGCTSSTDFNIPLNRQVNTSAKIHTMANKAVCRMMLQSYGVSVPYSIDCNTVDWDMHKNYIVRPSIHSQGRDLALVNGRDLKDYVMRKYNNFGWYAGEYIPKEREIRVYVLKGRIVKVDEKIIEDKTLLAWNGHEGSTFKTIRWGDWPIRACRLAIDAARVTECDFSGIDIMIDAKGNPFIVEMNSAPSLTYLEGDTISYSQRCMANGFMYHIANGWDTLPCDVLADHWSEYIHPGVAKTRDGRYEG